ncbi:hypothetical protein ACF0H5_015072 [Mactra antiquata]
MDQAVMKALLVVVVALLYETVSANTIEAKMGNATDNDCGDVYVLGPSREVRLQSDGLAPQGYCGVSVFMPSEVLEYQCDAICVTYKTVSISTCEIKVKFVGHMFRKGGDIVREYNCHQQSRESFCWNVGSLRVEVIESYNYAYVAQKPLYEFDIDVSARCTKDSVISAKSQYHAIKQKLEDDERQTYVEGIAVGISLACVFLIVLFVAWCYTKHQAVAGGPSSSSEPRPRQSSTHKKGNFITTFRKKFHIQQKSTETDEPEAIYRKTDTPSATRPSGGDSEITIPLTKESDAETFELANEAPADNDKGTGEDSPKDGGAEASDLDPPEVIISPGTPLPPDETD